MKLNLKSKKVEKKLIQAWVDKKNVLKVQKILKKTDVSLAAFISQCISGFVADMESAKKAGK